MLEGVLRSPEKTRVGEGTRGKRKEKRDREAEQTPMKEHTGLSVP